MECDTLNLPWMIVRLGNTKAAINAASVQSMVKVPEVTEVPDYPFYVRGVINLRGQVIPLVDLRVRLGLSSLLQEVEEFCLLMDQREEDHRNWLIELEACVREEREFKLATDPHKCAFGKWYDNFKTENHILAGLLKKFDFPHRRIHSIAEEVTALVNNEKNGEAQAVIDGCRNRELAMMIKLFSQVKKVYRENTREIAAVLESGKNVFAVTVDAIDSVEQLAEGSVTGVPETLFGGVTDNIIVNTGRRKKNDELVFLLDHGRIMAEEMGSL